MVWITLNRKMPSRRSLGCHLNLSGEYNEIDFITHLQAITPQKRSRREIVFPTSPPLQITQSTTQSKSMSSFQAQFLSLTQTLSVASEKSVRWADQAGRRKMSKLSSSFRRQPKSEDKPLRRFRLDMEKGAEPVSTLVTTKVTKVTTATVGSAHTGTVVTTQTPQPVELPQAPIVIPKNPYKKSKPSEPVKSIVKAPSKAKARKSKGKSQSPSHLKTKKVRRG